MTWYFPTEKHRFIVVLCLFLFSCTPVQTSDTSSQPERTEIPVATTSPDPVPESVPAISINQTGFTEPIPSAYCEPCKKQGTVEPFTYQTRNYTDGEEAVTKPAFVYLPYGYGESHQQYDILYLMHGWQGTAGYFLSFDQGVLRNILDHMIDNGDMKPVIVVSVTFDVNNESETLRRSIDEVKNFYREFENDLMPSVEEHYRTYAKSGSREDLTAARDHRAFGGFSLGSVATWFEFIEAHDYIRCYLPMSASCWYYGEFEDNHPEELSAFLEQIVRDHELNEKGYFIYAGVGSLDDMKTEVDQQMNAMFEREVFTSDHVVYYQKNDGMHNYDTAAELIYNALPLFFPADANVN